MKNSVVSKSDHSNDGPWLLHSAGHDSFEHWSFQLYCSPFHVFHLVTLLGYMASILAKDFSVSDYLPQGFKSQEEKILTVLLDGKEPVDFI